MRNKKIIVLSFLIIFGLLFSFNLPEVKAITIEELRSQITKLQRQITQLKQQLIEIQGEEPESSVQKLTKSQKAELAEIQGAIKRKGGLWKADDNKIFRLNEKEKKKLLGLKLSIEELNKESSIQQFPKSTEGLPDFFDWRDQHGDNYITSIKDQGQCGSCWAFGAATALEGNIKAHYNDPDFNLDLSEQDLVSCFHGSGCSGANVNQIKEIFTNYYQSKGITTEDCFPYTATNNNCNNKCSDWENISWKTNSYIEANLMVNNIDNIKKVLTENGPIEVGMVVYQDFFSYSEGIYRHTYGSPLGGHAVTIVGFGVYDGINYWIVKNSWGSDWGENGYFRIATGECGIDSMFAFAAVNPIPYEPQQRLCNDNDRDGYCNWGIGEKPATGCPICNEIIMDCDDSNPDLFKGCGKLEGVGYLSITSNPSEAEVYIKDVRTQDFIYRGITPLVTRLNPGSREIMIKKRDYYDYSKSVEIVENQTTNLFVDLKPISKIIYPQSNDIFRPGNIIKIKGTVGGYPSDSVYNFQSYTIEYGSGENPTEWLKQGINLIDNGTAQIIDGTLATWDTSLIKNGFYNLRLVINYSEGKKIVEFAKNIYFDSTLKKGWPITIEWDKLDGTSEESLDSLMMNQISSNIKFEDTKTDSVVSPDDKLFGPGGAGPIQNGYFRAGHLMPVISDINNNGFKEIIVFKNGNIPKILVYKHDGSLLWSKDIGDSPSLLAVNPVMPVVDDIDGDGFKEIFVYRFIAKESILDLYSDLYAFDYKGNLLKGWPVELSFDYRAKILLADLDLDGKKEIIFKGNYSAWERNIIAIFNKEGQKISQWEPTWSHWFNEISSSLAVGNFDDDPELEIVSGLPFGYPDGYKCAKGIIDVYNMDGSEVKGWPVYTDGMILSSPAIGDINNDGELEIVVGLVFQSDENIPDNRYGGVYVFDKDGNVLPGWPFKKGWNFLSSPALADFDNDGNLEIVISRLGGETYILNHNGVVFPGWPQKTINNNYYSSIIADINNDGVPDVITNSGDGIFPDPERYGSIYAWNFNGTSIKGFPKITEQNTLASPTVDDIDNDGKLELIASSDWNVDLINNKNKNRGSIYVWELDGDYNENLMPWPMFQHDPQNTGLYSKPSGLIEKSLKVTFPNGGVFRVTKSSRITWKQIGLEEKEVDILLAGYSKDGKQIDDWKIIQTNVPADREFIFWLPRVNDSVISSFSTLPDKYKIRITEVNDESSAVTDTSDDYFTIDFGTRPSITITSPKGGEQITKNEYLYIDWGKDNWTGNDIDIFLGGYDENGNQIDDWKKIIRVSEKTAGFAWVPSQSNIFSTFSTLPIKYNIKLREVLDSTETRTAAEDISDGYFTVDFVTSITITSPKGGDKWYIGDTHNITWEAKGEGLLTISIGPYSGGARKTIANNIPASQGSYSWDVGSFPETSIEPADDYKIVIINSTGLIGDWTEKFSIARREQSEPFGLESIENQLADISQAISGLMEKIKELLRIKE